MRLPYLMFYLLLGWCCSLSGQHRELPLREYDVLRVGYGRTTGTRPNGSLIFGSEMRWLRSPATSLGVRLEAAVYGGGPDPDRMGAGVTAGLFATGDYYLRRAGGYGPFVGGALGVVRGVRFGLTYTGPNTLDVVSVGRTGVAVALQVGYRITNLRVVLSYLHPRPAALPGYFSLTVAPTLAGTARKRS